MTQLLLDLASNDYNTNYLLSFRSPYIKDNPSRHSGSTNNLTFDSQKKLPLKVVTFLQWPTYVQQLNDTQVFGHCPVRNCHVNYHFSLANFKDTDVVIFTWNDIRGRVPVRAKEKQMYAFYRMEPPLFTNTVPLGSDRWNQAFNWTMHYRYIRQLTAHIAVDSYGKCGTLKCGAFLPVDTCLSMLTPHYHFYLAFENSYCLHYVTEKFFKTFKQDVHVVPIVRGGADYSRYFPRGTYIDADWFSSPDQLGKFLKALMRDTRTYAKMLWRKAHFVYHEHGIVDMFCQLCDKLHHEDDPNFRTWHTDLTRWYSRGKCQYSPSRIAR